MATNSGSMDHNIVEVSITENISESSQFQMPPLDSSTHCMTSEEPSDASTVGMASYVASQETDAPKYSTASTPEEPPPAYEDYIKQIHEKQTENDLINRTEAQKSNVSSVHQTTNHDRLRADIDSQPSSSSLSSDLVAQSGVSADQESQSSSVNPDSPPNVEPEVSEDIESDSEGSVPHDTSRKDSDIPSTPSTQSVKTNPILALIGRKSSRFSVSRVTHDSGSISSVPRMRSFSSGSQETDVFDTDSVSANTCAVKIEETAAEPSQKSPNVSHDQTKLQPLYKRNENKRISPSHKELKALIRQNIRRPSIDLSQVTGGLQVVDLEDNLEETESDNQTKAPIVDEKSSTHFQQNISAFSQLGKEKGIDNPAVILSVDDLSWLKRKSGLPEGTTPVEPRPDDHMALSCMVLLCCNLFFGIAAFGFSVATNTSYDKGEFERSRTFSRFAKITALSGVAITFFLVIALLIIFWPEQQPGSSGLNRLYGS